MRSFIILFILGTSFCYSKSTKERLQGNWVNLKITDSLGHQSSGELGASSDFLRFTFSGNSLFISQAPFDTGARMNIWWYENYFRIVNYGLTQTEYFVISVDEHSLVLRTTSFKGKVIDYHFANQKNYAENLDKLSQFFDVGIVHINFVFNKNSGFLFQTATYEIRNSILNLIPFPQYKGRSYKTFSNFLDSKFRLPRSLEPNSKSEELIVDFDVQSNGISDIRIYKHSNQDLDMQAFNLIAETRKNWHPVIYNNTAVPGTIRLRFVFTFIET